jgi:hypothetical protein
MGQGCVMLWILSVIVFESSKRTKFLALYGRHGLLRDGDIESICNWKSTVIGFCVVPVLLLCTFVSVRCFTTAHLE